MARDFLPGSPEYLQRGCAVGAGDVAGLSVEAAHIPLAHLSLVDVAAQEIS